MNKANLLARFKHVHLAERHKDVADPVLALSERLQEVPYLIDRVVLNHEHIARHKPLEFSQPEFTDSNKVHELVAVVNSMSERLQAIIDCSICLTMTVKEALRSGCIYSRGQMKELIGGIKALEGLPVTIESIRSNILSCEHEVQNIRNDVSRTTRLFFTVANDNLSALCSDRALFGV